MYEFFSNLKINRWFKSLMYLGGIIFLYSLFGDVKWLNNKSFGLLGLALFFIGLGEWKNEKIAVEYKSPNAYTGPAAILQYPIRKLDLLGVFFLLIGSLLICLFIREII